YCRRRAFFTVGETWWNDEPALAADFHAGHALIPALDDVAEAEAELERLLPLNAVLEHSAVREITRVMDDDDVAFLGFRALADFQVGHLEPAAAAGEEQTHSEDSNASLHRNPGN